MEKIKYKIDILKFKVTIFATLTGGGIYLLTQQEKLIPFIDLKLLWFTVVVILFYGSFGFLANLLRLNKIYKELEHE